MYCIIKNEYFYKKYYIPLILKQMEKHNIKFMDIRTIVGTLFKVVNGKKKYIPINEELEYLSQFNKYFDLIICFSKGNNHKKIISKINEIYQSNISLNLIKGIDIIGDESKHFDITELIDDLLIV
jgi:GTP cyclohydrolase III